MSRVLIGLLMCFIAFGCSSKMEQRAYSTLSISQTTYDTTLSVLSDLYKQGKITTEKKNEIVEKARDYKEAHNLAVKAFVLYKESGLVKDEQDYLIAMTKATALLAEFLHLAEPYLE